MNWCLLLEHDRDGDEFKSPDELGEIWYSYPDGGFLHIDCYFPEPTKEFEWSVSRIGLFKLGLRMVWAAVWKHK